METQEIEFVRMETEEERLERLRDEFAQKAPFTLAEAAEMLEVPQPQLNFPQERAQAMRALAQLQWEYAEAMVARRAELAPPAASSAEDLSSGYALQPIAWCPPGAETVAYSVVDGENGPEVARLYVPEPGGSLRPDVMDLLDAQLSVRAPPTAPKGQPDPSGDAEASALYAIYRSAHPLGPGTGPALVVEWDGLAEPYRAPWRAVAAAARKLVAPAPPEVPHG